MENSIEKTSSTTGAGGGVKISCKTKSLDLRSIYKSRVSKEGLSERGKFVLLNGGEARGDDKRKKRKRGKEVSLDSLLPVVKKSWRNLDEGHVNDAGSGSVSVDSGRSLSGLSQKNGLNGLSLSLGGSGDVIHIPKRPRGSVRRRKFAPNGVAKISGPSSSLDPVGKLNEEPKKVESSGSSSGEAGSDDRISKLLRGSGDNVLGSKVKRKRNVDERKESRKGRSSSSLHVKEEDGHAVVNNGEASSKKRRNKVKQKRNVEERKESRNGRSSSSLHVTKEDGHAVVDIGEASSKKRRSKVKQNRNVDEGKESRNGRSSSSWHVKEEDGHAVVNNGEASSKKRRSKVKRKRNVDEVKESRNGRSSLSQHVKEEDSHVVVDNGDASSKKRRSNHRKRKDLASRSQNAQKKVEPIVDNSNSVFDDFQDDDDDEEKLEQNAARMLSSRFDPRCTGFTSKSRSSGRLSDNTVSLSSSAHRDFVSRGVGSSAGLKSKDASRVLRPRKQLNEKGLSRKRRHFYEISTSDLDAFWFLNRRIKVFWPLDESWYYGLVNDYDPKRKLHHVKYDDRDEEWIDLHNEKFKLLLLPSEVPGKAEGKKSPTFNEYIDTRELDSEDDDSYEGNYLDSEPIISWLSRSSRQVKSSPSSHLKKKKKLHLSLSVVPPALSVEADDTDGDVGSWSGDGSKSDCDSTLPDKSADGERADNSLLGSPSSSKGSPCVVYVRRRLGKKTGGLSPVCKKTKACRSSLQTFTFSTPVGDSLDNWKGCDSSLGCSETDNLLWSVDDQGLLRMKVPLGESIRFRFDMCLPLSPFLSCSFIADWFGFSHALVLPHYGTIRTTWPEVALEMLFVDNANGLRFLLFEGCLNLAVELFSLILTVFNEFPREWKFFDMKLPITSIRFKLSSTQYLGKQQEFAFYSFSKLKQSKWLFLDSKLRRHCLLSKQLPISECTYDNIKTLDGRSCQLSTPYVGAGFSPVKKRFMRSILPVVVSRESSSNRMSQPAANPARKLGKLPTFALSFTAAPTFFLSLHLKMLMEHNFACVTLQDYSSLSFDDSESRFQPFLVHSAEIDSCPENVPGRYGSSEVSDGDRSKSVQDLGHGKIGVTVSSSCSKDFEGYATSIALQPNRCESHNHEAEQIVASPVPAVSKTVAPLGLSNTKSYSSLGGLSIELPSFDHFDKPLDGGVNISRQVPDLASNTSDGLVQSPCPTDLRSSCCLERNSLGGSPFGELSPVWPDGKSTFISNGFGTGPKKPRTQVQYTLPPGGYDSSSRYKSHNQRVFPYKRIRRSTEKRLSDGLRNSEKSLELLACDANVLVTLRDKGWRECGARIVLELADQNEWRLAVKVSGLTKYSYKVNHILQPGSTNRYTHAMMWKGGKDWVLEFPDRSQWIIFKELHEECHNRNIRAASMKSIPIPGVRLIEESDDYATDVLFIHNPNYIRQVESDVDMAMDPSRILYDMDSDDEDWILRNVKSLGTDENTYKEMSCALFEKMVDMLEKFAYSQQRDRFTFFELQELMVGIDSTELVKGIYEHWRQKRQREGMPLIRHFQPPLWERYQQQIKEWEQAVPRATATSSIGFKEKKLLIEKPPMFAFCLKPRGLEIPNKGSKHRSQRRFPVSGHNQTVSGDHDGYHTPGRRLNGFAFGDEKSVFSGNSHEFSDSSPSLHASSRVFSPRDASGLGFFSLNSDVPAWNHYPKYYRNKPKKTGTFSLASSSQLVPYSQRTIGMRNGAQRWNMDLPEWRSQKHHIYEGSQCHGMEQLDGSDLHEFRLRDASGAAQHALNMAQLKRDRAQRLLYKADLAIHKAVVALMTAEAKKASFERSNCDG